MSSHIEASSPKDAAVVTAPITATLNLLVAGCCSDPRVSQTNIDIHILGRLVHH